jgi:DNA topoisomerase I
MTKKKLIIVEAPSKAQTIKKYVGPSYEVLASWGHVRDLPAKKGSVLPEKNFELIWNIPEKAQKHLDLISKAVSKADTLILATDLDREGEAISWHILEYLKSLDLLKNQTVHRATFNAVTKDAVLKALESPRELDNRLVQAYLARLSLDYLVGFTLSPVLWKKLPGSRSAGRVQSVALRIVVEREEEIRAFKAQEYWTVHGEMLPSPLLHLSSAEERPFSALLTSLEGEKLEKFSLDCEEKANAAAEIIRKASFSVEKVEKKPKKRQAPPPFITSSLQQDASRKLGFAPSRTMRIAQTLYEGVDLGGNTMGLITYLRTDSLFILPEVLKQNRDYIVQTFGPEYLTEEVKTYKASRNAQEAHEAIRPTDIRLAPQEVRDSLSDEQFSLYKLIWDRTLASQMQPALYDQTTIHLISDDAKHRMRASGSVLIFNGFLVLYEESHEEDETDEDLIRLPLVEEGQNIITQSIVPEQHTTVPPGRYSEASLIKKMEDLGIGRPSTYARIVQVLQEREYVRKEKKKLMPEEKGHLVLAFLRHFFSRYVDYQFTAQMEDQLDMISSGDKEWKSVLSDFWNPFIQTIQESEGLSIQQVISTIEPDVLGYTEPLSCPKCEKGQLHLKLGKSNLFLGCSQYPDCTYTQALNQEESSQESADYPKVLGNHPETEKEIFLKKGPYGFYVEHDTKRATINNIFAPTQVTLETALWLISLPAKIGEHPETQDTISLGIGRFGPYLKMKDRFYTVKKDKEELKNITLSDACLIIAEAGEKKPRSFKSKTTSEKTTSKKAPTSKADASRTKKTSSSSTSKTTSAKAKSTTASSPKKTITKKRISGEAKLS